MEKVVKTSLEAAAAALIFCFMLGKFQEFLAVVSSY